MVAVTVHMAQDADWDLALFGILLGFSALSDAMAIQAESR
jgi:hypothetical protein